MKYKTIDLSDVRPPRLNGGIVGENEYCNAIEKNEEDYSKSRLNKCSLLEANIKSSKKWLLELKEYHKNNSNEIDPYKNDFYYRDSKGKIILKAYKENILYYYKEFISSDEKATKENISLEKKEEITQNHKQILDTVKQALDIIFSNTYAEILTYENIDIFQFLRTLYDKDEDENYPKEKKKYSKEEMVGIIDYICYLKRYKMYKIL